MEGSKFARKGMESSQVAPVYNDNIHVKAVEAALYIH